MLPVDPARVALFGLLGSSAKLFRRGAVERNTAGEVWQTVEGREVRVALSALGPGWVFDPVARERRKRLFRREFAGRSRPDDGAAKERLEEVVRRVRLGPCAGRLLWALHSAAVEQRSSVITVADRWLAEAVWGGGASRRPRHWRGAVLRVLEGLSHIHAGAADGAAPPDWGVDTALINSVRKVEIACPGDCGWPRPQRHGHLVIDLGRGFLGTLERFARVAEDGSRTYVFPDPAVGPPKGGKAKGPGDRWGRVSWRFAPAVLGKPEVCAGLSPDRHRLLQAIVGERTRDRRGAGVLAPAARGLERKIRNFRGDGCVTCPMLPPGGPYAGFNGNGRRWGMGYRLATEGGWMAKAGYPTADPGRFLEDLAGLAETLGLVVLGIDRRDRLHGLDRMATMAHTSAGRAELGALHVRIYASGGYLERWASHFGWSEALPAETAADATAAAVAADLKQRKLSVRALAAAVGIDHSFLAKVLAGKKSPPRGLWRRVWESLNPPQRIPACRTSPGMAALEYRRRGWSVIPIATGGKKPPIKWKGFQERRPTEAELKNWYAQWPDAGVALVLGPVSRVLVIDVDGPEAYLTLIRRLGAEPMAPKALSGSRSPYRFHLFFRHPEGRIGGEENETPWHPKLEFKDGGRFVVLPPSRHPKGGRYAWVEGRSPDDLEPPEIPPEVVAAIRGEGRRSPEADNGSVSLGGGDDRFGTATREFLAGKWSEGPGWNDRLFRAACDMKARGVPPEAAEPMLLDGAKPWNENERAAAVATIRSAYSRDRKPARR
jgi:hypothetical protein